MGSIVDESLLQRAAAEFVKIGHLDHSQGEWMKDDISLFLLLYNVFRVILNISVVTTVISDEEEEEEEEEEEGEGEKMRGKKGLRDDKMQWWA